MIYGHTENLAGAGIWLVYFAAIMRDKPALIDDSIPIAHERRLHFAHAPGDGSPSKASFILIDADKLRFQYGHFIFLSFSFMLFATTLFLLSLFSEAAFSLKAGAERALDYFLGA